LVVEVEVTKEDQGDGEDDEKPWGKRKSMRHVRTLENWMYRFSVESATEYKVQMLVGRIVLKGRVRFVMCLPGRLLQPSSVLLWIRLRFGALIYNLDFGEAKD
jgi:hypothetical protein